MTGPITWEMAGAIFGAVLFAVGLLWRLTVMRDEIVREIGQTRKEIKGEIDAVETKLFDEIEKVGGRVNAVATELGAHKLHVAETYTTKASFHTVSERVLNDIKGVQDAIESRLIRIEERVTSAAAGRRAGA